MAVEEIYRYDKGEYARRVYGTVAPAHPGVARVAAMGELLLGGKISLVNPTPTPFAHYKLSPLETRLLFEEKGWRTVHQSRVRQEEGRRFPGRGDPGLLPRPH